MGETSDSPTGIGPVRIPLHVISSYLLQLANGDPADPAVYVEAEGRQWAPGDSFTARDGSRWRIVAIDAVSPELAAEGFEATWIVEPLEVIRRDNWRVCGGRIRLATRPQLGADARRSGFAMA